MATDVEISGGPVASSQEPSYYEIALTNRQVVVAFVILLTCLLAAFFAGVWIGRESGVRAQEKLAQAAAAPAAPREGQALEEFQFFKQGDGKKGKKGKSGEPAAAPAAADEGSDTGPKGSPLEVPQPPAATPGRPALFTEREPAVKTPAPVPPVAGPTPLPDKKPPAPPVARPAPVKPALAAPDRLAQGAPNGPNGKAAGKKGKAAAEEAAAAPAGGGKLVIQVFSSPDKEQADKIKEQLVASGQKAFLSPIRGAGRTMYRVRIGPFDSHEKAEKVAGQVRKEQRLDTWITPQ